MLKRSTFRNTWTPPPRARDLPPPPAPAVRPLVAGTYGGPVGVPVVLPKPEKVKPGKRTPNAQERAWMDFIVAHGCIACWIDGNGFRPPAVHHILRGGQRIGHLDTLPLCDPGHHQNGQQFGMVSRHPWRKRFEARYGTEQELLARLRAEYAAMKSGAPA